MAVWSTVKISCLSPDTRWDAEHYRPEYIRHERRVLKLPTQTLEQVADISDGNHLSIAGEFRDEGVRYLRGQDLTEFFLSDTDPVFISEEAYERLARSHMHTGDVLVGIVGTIGTVGLVTNRHEKLTGSCKLAIIRPRELSSEYLASYLASRPGQRELKRRIRGAVQMGVILPDLRAIPIVTPTTRLLTRVVRAVRKAQECQRRARTFTATAEARLVAAIGLDRIRSTSKVSYVRRFKELQSEGRFDAEFFSPRYHQAVAALRRDGRTLEDVARLSEVAFRKETCSRGASFEYVEIGSLVGEGDVESTTVAVADTPSRAAWVLDAGNVITSTVRPIRRLSALIQQHQREWICSSGFAVLAPKDGPDGIEPEVLLTYLRLPIVCELLNLYSTASMYPAVPLGKLMEMPIVMPDKRTRKAIVAKVRSAISMRREAADLLRVARGAIEDEVGEPVSRDNG